jgi:hypothetical protein
LKRKWLLSILAVIPAVLIPTAIMAQVAPDRAPRAESTEPVYKYWVYGGYSYTSLNQVNQSRYGLSGLNFDVSRDWGKYFALTADGAFYWYAFRSGNPGNPSVSMVLFGPELHAPLYGKVGGFFRGMIGGEHTGGTGQTPHISFAGGPGGGLYYAVNPHWDIRASGDYIGSSFSVTNNSPQLGNSPHLRFNARAGVGAVYRF